MSELGGNTITGEGLGLANTGDNVGLVIRKEFVVEFSVYSVYQNESYSSYFEHCLNWLPCGNKT